MTEISRDFFAYLTLIKLDFIDIKDSIDWDMASKPDADFIFCDEFNINSGIQIKKSGFIKSFSTEYFFLPI